LEEELVALIVAKRNRPAAELVEAVDESMKWPKYA